MKLRSQTTSGSRGNIASSALYNVYINYIVTY